MNTHFEEISVGPTNIKLEEINSLEWEEKNILNYSELNENYFKTDENPEWNSENKSKIFQVKPLSCWVCEVTFTEYSAFTLHHIQHITQPYVFLTDLKDLAAGKLAVSNNKKNSGVDNSPLKLTLKKLTGKAQESSFKVINRKKKTGGGGYQGVGRRSAKTDTETNSQGGEGEPSSPSPASQTFNASNSPTPSEFLRPEGFLAPESAIPSPDENDEQNENGSIQNDFPLSPPQLTREDLESSLPRTENDDSNNEENVRENGLEEVDSESDLRNAEEENNVDSGVESEKDGFCGFEGNENQLRLPTTSSATPSHPTGRTLTILAPSQVNNNAVVNGSLLPEQTETSAVSEAFNALGNLGNSGENNEVREGLSVLSPAKLFNNSSNLLQNMDINSNSDPLGLLRSYIEPPSGNGMEFMPLDRLGGETCEVCGERTIDRDAMDQHKSTMGHFKCHVTPDCAVVLFGSASELTNHQQVAHGIMPTPPPVQQLAQQVQRLPVPYQGMGTPPPSSSPGYQNRSSPMYRVPTPVHMSYPQQSSPGYNANNGTPGFQGTIDRPFAMINNGPNQPISPHLSISPGVQISQQQMSPSQKRPGSVGSAEENSSKRSRISDSDCAVVSMQQQQQPVTVPTMPSLPGITLSVRGQQPLSIPQSPQQSSGKKGDASSVANILATRGITVTPTGNRGVPQPIVPSPRRNQQQPQVQAVPQPVTTLNLSSAISITPASQAARQNQFAVPQGRSMGRQQVQMDRSQRLPTVDLTQDTPVRRNRVARFTCQVCDKVFSSQEILNQHMMTHRSPTKLPYRCNLCNAQYPTQQGLQQHRLTYHKETAAAPEMVIPIVDLKQQGVLQKLTSIGIRHVIPLAQLTNQADGTFGLPIVAIDNARNPAVCNLGRLGASNVFSIGPAKGIGR